MSLLSSRMGRRRTWGITSWSASLLSLWRCQNTSLMNLYKEIIGLVGERKAVDIVLPEDPQAKHRCMGWVGRVWGGLKTGWKAGSSYAVTQRDFDRLEKWTDKISWSPTRSVKFCTQGGTILCTNTCWGEHLSEEQLFREGPEEPAGYQV